MNRSHNLSRSGCMALLLLFLVWLSECSIMPLSDIHNESPDWFNLMATFERYHERQRSTMLNAVAEDAGDHILPVLALNDRCSVVILPLEDSVPVQSDSSKKRRSFLVEDPPSSHGYQLTVQSQCLWNATVEVTDALLPSGSQIHFYSVNLESLTPILNHLLQWFTTSHGSSCCSDDVFGWDISIRTFAKQPRQHLPPLTAMQHTDTGSVMPIRVLRLHFVTIDAPLFDWMDRHVEALELTQCTVLYDWNRLLGNRASDASTIIPHIHELGSTIQRRALKLSCTLPEFLKFIPFLRSGTILLTELSLVLHFGLPDDPVMAEFGQAISTCSALTDLSIKYLDISDKGWSSFCASLTSHSGSPERPSLPLRTFSFGYTDDFVDNYRRLSHDRRLERTQAILNLVLAVPSLCHVSFPLYQQDAEVMEQVNEVLNARRVQ